MLKIFIISFLWSISPFGEAKVGIPYAIINELNIYLAFFICLLANIMVFPIMSEFLNSVNQYFFRWRWYKKTAIQLAKRIKRLSHKSVEKYGFWGLMIFVMTPLPGTGVYAGTIASFILGIEKKKAFWANTIGITISSIIIWTITVFTRKGIYLKKASNEVMTLIDSEFLTSFFG